MGQVFAVIMAGGVGARFWPRSRERTPKQLLEILDSGTMLEQTIARIRPMVESDHIFVVTNALHHHFVLQLLPFIPPENILVEPVGRNTAPCIGLAASWIKRRDPEGVMVVLPADHLVRNGEEFLKRLETAVHVAEETSGLITIGINPTHPETGYGYIQFADDEQDRSTHRERGVYRVKTFAEKPNLETAQRFLKSGDFLWNSGMFAWKASSIEAEIETHLPELHEHLSTIEATIGTPAYQQSLEKAYGLMRGISVDYGVMEKAGKVYVVKGDFGWSDVGSWDEVARLSSPDSDGNVLKGKIIQRDSDNTFIDAGEKVVAAVGVSDLIIIATDDAVLVCRKGESQNVKEIVDYLRRKQMNEYL